MTRGENLARGGGLDVMTGVDAPSPCGSTARTSPSSRSKPPPVSQVVSEVDGVATPTLEVPQEQPTSRSRSTSTRREVRAQAGRRPALRGRHAPGHPGRQRVQGPEGVRRHRQGRPEGHPERGLAGNLLIDTDDGSTCASPRSPTCGVARRRSSIATPSRASSTSPLTSRASRSRKSPTSFEHGFAPQDAVGVPRRGPRPHGRRGDQLRQHRRAGLGALVRGAAPASRRSSAAGGWPSARSWPSSPRRSVACSAVSPSRTV